MTAIPSNLRSAGAGKGFERKAALLAHIASHGPSTTAQLQVVLDGCTRTVGREVQELKDSGQLVQVFDGWIGGGKVKKYRYALPVKQEYARIGATRYRGWKPSGT